MTDLFYLMNGMANATAKLEKDFKHTLYSNTIFCEEVMKIENIYK